MAIDLEALRKRQKTLKSGGGNYWRPADGERTIVRFFSFSHGGEEHIEAERVVHFVDKKPQPCGGRGCEYCEEYRNLMQGSDEDKELAKDIRAVRKFQVNVFADGEMRTWEMPTTAFDQLLSYVLDPEYGTSILGAKGRDFIVEFDSKKDPATMYTLKIRDASKSKALGKDAESAVKDLLSTDATRGNEGGAPPKTRGRKSAGRSRRR